MAHPYPSIGSDHRFHLAQSHLSQFQPRDPACHCLPVLKVLVLTSPFSRKQPCVTNNSHRPQEASLHPHACRKSFLPQTTNHNMLLYACTLHSQCRHLYTLNTRMSPMRNGLAVWKLPGMCCHLQLQTNNSFLHKHCATFVCYLFRHSLQYTHSKKLLFHFLKNR